MKTLPLESRKIILANLLVTVIFFSTVIPGIIFDKNNSFQSIDQNKYHLPQVEAFVKKPPSWGIYPSSTATTPGHHLVLSWVSKYLANGQVDRKIFPIRIANALFSLGLLLTVWWLTYLGGTGSVTKSTYLVLPLLFSYQFLGGAIWVMTDNAALLWVCLTLLVLTLSVPLKRENFTLTLAGVFASLAIAWRQTHAWLLIPIFFSVVKVARDGQRWYLYPVTLLPLLLVLGYFVSLWHGLTPPEFASYHVRGFNFAAPTFIISLFGIFGLFYIGYLSRALQKLNKSEILWLIVISVIVGFGIAIVFPASYNRSSGSWGGWLWEISRQLPTIYGRSVLFLVLCPLGTVLISLWCKAIYKYKNDILILVSMLAWIAASTATVQTFQRYYELLILITFTFLASRQSAQFRRSYLGPLILTGLMAAISLKQIVFD